MSRVSIGIVAVFVVCSASIGIARPPTTQEAERYNAWVEQMTIAVQNDPDDATAWQRLAQAQQLLGNQQQALDGFKQLARLEPDNWRAHSKLVQCYQALGMQPERDQAREKVFELHRAGKVPDKEQQFCIEQFDVGEKRVMAFERFEMKGDRAVRYVFYVFDPGEEQHDYRLSLGSYDSTTEISRELGHIKLDERIWHLDAYYRDGSHATWGMFNVEPGYVETRKMVTDVVAKRVEEISSSTPPTTRGDK